MRVTVIGTSGQLASELHRRNWPSGLQAFPAEKVDLTQPEALAALLDRQRPELILNAAAYTAVDRAESEPERAFAVNAAGVELLATWCANHGAALVHVSTDYVFDGSGNAAYQEHGATGPVSVYGASKLAGERAIGAALASHVILRTSWVFSAHGQNFVKTMLRLARERDELRVIADQHGRPTAAADLADAMLLVAQRIREGAKPWGIFHFAGAGPTTWHGFAEAIVEEQARFTGRRPPVVPIATSEYPTAAKRPANSVLDTSKFEATFGLTPRNWRAGLHEVIEDLLQPGLEPGRASG